MRHVPLTSPLFSHSTFQLERFDSGRREEFFGLWERHIPAALLANDVDTAKVHKRPFLPLSQ
jgi:hypothetical protein